MKRLRILAALVTVCMCHLFCILDITSSKSQPFDDCGLQHRMEVSLRATAALGISSYQRDTGLYNSITHNVNRWLFEMIQDDRWYIPNRMMTVTHDEVLNFRKTR